MRVASTILGAALALASSSVRAGNVDKDGFTMDGVATYCQGLGKAAGTFPQLETSSLNRCPILVNITPGATTVHKNTPLEVKFKATAKFGEIPGNIFPRAIVDQGAKKVNPVTASFVKYCKAGSNCDKPMDGTPFGAEAVTGDFDATGLKTLPSYRFTFTDPGDYILFGQVTLPGDPALDVSGQQFVAFQKITVVDTAVSIAPSPSPTASPPLSSSAAPSSSSPAPSNGTTAGADAAKNKTTSGSVAGESGLIKGAVEKPSSGSPSTPSKLPSEGTETNSGSAGDSKGFFASHGTLLAAVAGGCVVVLVMGYAMAMRRKKQGDQAGAKADPRGPTPTFRMSHNNHHSSDDMDDPEPVAYVRKKSVRSNNTQHSSLPILGGGGTSTSSTDEIDAMHIHKADERVPSFDEMDDSSYDEGTVTASNKAIPTQKKNQPMRASSVESPRGMAASSLYDDDDMPPSSLYDDRETSLYVKKSSKKDVRDSDEERGFYESEQWDGAATARPYDDRDASMISLNDDEGSRTKSAFEASRFQSQGATDFEEGRTSRLNSEASVDSYAFRPSRVSVAESYQSGVSRYSYADSEMSRESSRISGMSLYSDRGTNV
jgi:hypothetical protein